MDEMIFGRRYRITEKIGSGGMADVYKAIDETLGRTVAVKVLHPTYVNDTDFVDRFRHEASAAANLSHPSIVNIYDYGVEDVGPYIVMELVRGMDLKRVLREQGKLDPRLVAEYGSQVCSALSAAHGYGIIHRDIKPQNIIVTPDGVVKVMDFGIARAVDSDATQTGSVLGTAQYVSPEQAQGRRLGPESDLYSLGVVLYELSTGHLPFTGDTPVSVALKHVNDAPVPPRQIDPSVPPALEAVIMKAMQKDPRLRYHSAEEMREDLQRVAQGRGVAAQPRVDDTTVMPAVAAAPLARTAAAGTPPSKGTSPWIWVAIIVLLVLIAGGAAYALGLFTPAKNAVPDVSGQTVTSATVALVSAGFTVADSQEQTASDTFAKDLVVGTDPPAGSVSATSPVVVTLIVSTGPPLVAVPNVVGSAEASAAAALEAAQLTPNVNQVYNPKVKAGLVYKTDPAAGAMVTKQTLVQIYVSKGAQMVAVPDVTGKSKSLAISELKAAGFDVNTPVYHSDSTVASGHVISQDPTADSAQPLGTSVTITVSTGPQQVTVPDLTGLTSSHASDELTALGLTPNPQNGDPSPDVSHPAGTVESQDKTPGSKVDIHSTVTFQVYT